jgi:hypothetical protein
VQQAVTKAIMGGRTERNFLSTPPRNSQGQVAGIRKEASGQGHKRRYLEAGTKAGRRTPSRPLEIPKEDRSPKVLYPRDQKWSILIAGTNP